jgi:phage FluMu gp28-like protein
MKPYFLPYQIKWLRDNSRYKICEKSRRIGMTYVQSYEDVKDASKKEGSMDVWFSSADESAASEYIRYCQQWAKVFNIAAKDLGENIIENPNKLKGRLIEFSTGKRIYALSSNPKGFRSKGGKLVLDEFAFHGDQEAMWKAARPIITWGYPCRILSTYNGKSNRYYRMVEEAKKGNNWSLHSTTIYQAVEQGLADRILNQTLTPQERQKWIEEERETCGDEETWQQEYLCNPMDEATAWLTWDLIFSCEHPDAGQSELYTPSQNFCFVGMDIARRRDLTVIWVLEQVGDVLWTREVVALKNAKFKHQRAELERIMSRYKVLRLCLDQTGMGENMAEWAIETFGAKAEGVLFTANVKQDMAQGLKRLMEDRKLRNPPEKDIRESLHSVKKTTTSAGNPRFDAERNEIGHADYFWAEALAVHAAARPLLPFRFQSVGRQNWRDELALF